MSLIVLWKHIIVGAWVKIKMSGGGKNSSILYVIINCHARVSHKAGINARGAWVTTLLFKQPRSSYTWMSQFCTSTGRLNPSRETKFSRTHGDKGILFLPLQVTTSRIGNLSRLIHTLLYM